MVSGCLCACKCLLRVLTIAECDECKCEAKVMCWRPQRKRIANCSSSSSSPSPHLSARVFPLVFRPVIYTYITLSRKGMTAVKGGRAAQSEDQLLLFC